MQKEESRWATDDLELFERLSWELLTRGAQSPKEDAHWPTLATVDAAGRARARTVVLRRVERAEGALEFYTDARAQKVRHLQDNPWASVHVYDGSRRVQVRAQVRAHLHVEDEVARERWEGLGARGRLDYCRQPAPATPSEQWETGLEPSWKQDPPDAQQIQWAFANFCVMRCVIESMDALYLARSGHRRALFDLTNQTRSWVIP